MIIALVGPPGAGKGTQAAELAKKGYITFSVGELMRASQDPRVGQTRDSGELVDPELVVDVVIAKLLEHSPQDKLVIDGFPRNKSQVALFDVGLGKLGRKLDAVLFLSVPKEVSIERLSSRYQELHRADDEPAVMENRFKVYGRETAPMVELYRQRGLLHEVDGTGSVAEVAKRVEEALGAAKI